MWCPQQKSIIDTKVVENDETKDETNQKPNDSDVSVHEHQHPICAVVVKQTWKMASPYGVENKTNKKKYRGRKQHRV